jgi:hypothetical protein
MQTPGRMFFLVAYLTANIATGQIAPVQTVPAISSNSTIMVIQSPSIQQSHSGSPIQSPTTNLIHTTQGKQSILNKLDRIRIDTIAFDNLPLGEVVQLLAEKARRLDPERRGINFIVLPNAGSAVGVIPPVGRSPTDQPSPASAVVPPREATDVNGLSINLAAPLEDICLHDVLEVLTKIAPLRYSVEDYAVVLRLKTTDDDSLYVRAFKVDPNTFREGLESVVGFPFGNLGSGAAGAANGTAGGSILTLPRVSIAPNTGVGGAGLANGGGISSVTRPTPTSGTVSQ